jgi:hypothetical protein
MPPSILNSKLDPEDLNKLNRYIVQDGFHKKLKSIGQLNLSITQAPHQSGLSDLDNHSFNQGNIKVIKGLSKRNLDPKNGQTFSTKVCFSGYDESKLQFNALEGNANITSHSLLSVVEEEYHPISLITVYFYTRSQELTKLSDSIRQTDNPEADSNRDYAIDRNEFITEHIIENSILFIDGPLIGGNLSSYSLKLISKLHEKNVIPIFLVKNSDSNLITKNIKEVRTHFNSDLHWAYKYLNPGEMSNYFQYTDKTNPNNTKIFSYIKPYKRRSPQRIELHPETYTMYQNYIGDIFDMIYYLTLVEGNINNPQIRPISIAEKYAREIIKTVNTRTFFRYTSLIPTMNQKRFGV